MKRICVTLTDADGNCVTGGPVPVGIVTAVSADVPFPEDRAIAVQRAYEILGIADDGCSTVITELVVGVNDLPSDVVGRVLERIRG